MLLTIQSRSYQIAIADIEDLAQAFRALIPDQHVEVARKELHDEGYLASYAQVVDVIVPQLAD